MIRCVEMMVPGQGKVLVNPAALTAVQAFEDRPGKTTLHLGSSTLRVLGAPDEILQKLGWATDVPAPDSGMVPPEQIGDFGEGEL